MVSFNKQFMMPEKKTQEQVQAEIDAMPLADFLKSLAYWLGHIGCHGQGTYYLEGEVTPAGMRTRAFANRLANMVGDDSQKVNLKQDFTNFDERQKKEAEEVRAATPALPTLVWIDSDSYKKLAEELSITKALLTTYHVSGCMPLRTVTPEEMQSLAGQAL